MRELVMCALLPFVAGCASQPATPRQYLDATTAATITAVAQPWVLASESRPTAHDERDFLSLYAIDVNRMGQHRQYLAVLQWWPDVAAAVPVLELRTGNGTIPLQPALTGTRELGIVEPPARAYTSGAIWWYFAVDKEVLTSVAAASELRAALVTGERRTEYIMWRDGSAELAELVAALP